MTKLHLYPLLTLTCAASVLLLFALQYPLQTTFPIGGDAASHIRVAQAMLDVVHAPEQAWLAVRQSNYPVAQLLLAASALLPTSWPDRFVWFMTTGHILTGVVLGLLLWRLGSWRSAAAVIAIWGLTPIGLNPHFEDGTAPQLFSLIFLILTFERLIAGATWSTLLLALATALTHPLSGFVLIASLALGVAIVFPVRRHLAPEQARAVKYLSALAALLILAVLIRAAAGISWPFAEAESDAFLIDIVRSKFAPWIVLSIPGLALLTNRLRRSLLASSSLLSFFWLSFLLTTNSNLNISLWENRFRTYFILGVTIAAALALPRLLRSAFRYPLTRSLCAVLLFASVACLTWRDNAAAYRFYENPTTHARLNPEVMMALTWMRDTLPADSVIASTAASRHTEWIPVLTGLPWHELPANHELFKQKGDDLVRTAAALPFTHVMFLTDHENVPEGLINHASFPIVFENKVAVIMHLP